MRKCELPGHERVVYTSGKSACVTCRRLKPKRNKEHYQRRWAREKERPGFKEAQARRARKMKYGFDGEVTGDCRICQERPATDVDHCHTTGRIRGFLCRRCNVWLAVVENTSFVQKAVGYLQK